MTTPTPQEIDARVEQLAASMVERKLAFSLSQARERARSIVLQEIAMQSSFDKMKDDPSLNPQQRKRTVSDEELRQAGGMLTGNELPKDVPLAELLKGRRKV